MSDPRPCRRPCYHAFQKDFVLEGRSRRSLTWASVVTFLPSGRQPGVRTSTKQAATARCSWRGRVTYSAYQILSSRRSIVRCTLLSSVRRYPSVSPVTSRSSPRTTVWIGSRASSVRSALGLPSIPGPTIPFSLL
ncbi:hypothetical protein MPTK1_2g03110 [Marchantia polymorpha subsp. ruderalis]|uniref:Uncharacterized protein n=1 Tax=Marchantia polymorpha TaxID=3197 RepID=A0A2R6WM96_MARPO|nr:hypothetical protein MARPO_0075s0072 [Marchantia polymorpha]BBN00921.1 hypothetical protein Mp_2g03110 [Marchantia polymorpha subsp. ruderalis]|eukprot:PTQ34975.1 hypothetical protein MARPO_0075s0072 [Marchantia polymorpha]